MDAKTRMIEIDAATADLLEAQAADRGISVSDFVAELVTVTGKTPEAQTAELDGRWADYLRTGRATIRPKLKRGSKRSERRITALSMSSGQA